MAMHSKLRNDRFAEKVNRRNFKKRGNNRDIQGIMETFNNWMFILGDSAIS